MNTLLHWLTSPEWALIVKALLHSLWQGAMIAVALALLLRRMTSPSARYRLALTGLGVVVAATIITWGVLNLPKLSATPAAPMPQATRAEIPVATGPVEKIVVAANWTPARQQTRWTAWLALAWLLGASAMLGRASVKIAGAEQLRRSCQPLNDSRINDLVAEARRAVKLTRQVRVAVTNQLTSPAVVGVLVPTLILPLSLVTTLSPEQLRFILLHELAHIRRGDYLANLFQLFAEALFFFNPSVWWLSHQIRREREACCDALAIELSGAPADYARTLVSVAEAILNPSPAAAPAFGNAREPSSLADRVQRVLVPGYRPSLRLTWRAMLAALGAGVVLLGLLAAGTRETVAATASLLATKPEGHSAQGASVSSVKLGLQEKVPVELANVVEVRADGSYWMGSQQLTLAEIGSRLAGLKNPHPKARLFIEDDPQAPDDALVQLDQLRREMGMAPVVETGSTSGKSTNELSTRVFTVDGSAFLAAVRQRLGKTADYPAGPLLTKLWAAEEIRPRQWMFKADEDRLVVRASIKELEAVTRIVQSSPAKSPTASGLDHANPTAVTPALAMPAAPGIQGKMSGLSVSSESATFNPSEKALTARGNVEITAANGMKITTEEARIQLGINSAAIGANTNLYSRTFKVDPNTFVMGLESAGGLKKTNLTECVRDFLAKLGVDLQPPKAMFFNERQGGLFVCASLADLDIIEQAIQVLNQAAPQVNIRARFVEVSGDGSGNLFLGTLGSAFTNSIGGKPANMGGNAIGPSGTNNPQVAGLTGILTPAQFKVVIRALEQREGVEILSMPDVTTVSGRQAQLQVVDIRTIVSGLSTVTATNGTSTNVFQTSELTFGPVLDVIPYVSADGFTVNMTLIPTVTEFVGYQKPDPALTKFAKEKSVNAELPLPIYRMRHATTSATVWDGQTIVIGGFTSEIVTRQPDGSKTKKLDPKPKKKQLFVFITPTIIDPAGNRVHTDEEVFPRELVPKPKPGK